MERLKSFNIPNRQRCGHRRDSSEPQPELYFFYRVERGRDGLGDRGKKQDSLKRVSTAEMWMPD